MKQLRYLMVKATIPAEEICTDIPSRYRRRDYCISVLVDGHTGSMDVVPLVYAL